MCGGNGSLSLDYTQYLPRWGRDTAYLFVDYPGYGLCSGSASPAGIRESFLALREPVSRALGVPVESLGEHSAVIGHSIGCASGLIGAEVWGTKRALLFAPFTTMTEMARLVVGRPFCYLNRHRFDNIEQLRLLGARDGRAIIIHGTDDEVIPVEMARELSRLHPSTCQLEEVPGATHNDVLHKASAMMVDAMRELQKMK